MNIDTLVSAQQEFESRALADGYDRFTKAQTNAATSIGASSTVEASKLIRGAIPLVSAEITAWVSRFKDGFGKGRVPASHKIIEAFDADGLAYLTLNAVYVSALKQKTVTGVNRLIGSLVEAEFVAKTIKDAKGAKVASRIAKQLKTQGSTSNKMKALKKLAKDALDGNEGWEMDFCVKIGEPLLNACLIALPDIFEMVTVPRSRNSMATLVRITEEAIQMLSDYQSTVAFNQPTHRPMVVLPRRWESLNTGCYYSDATRHTVQLVRKVYDRPHKKLLKDAIASGQMDGVLAAVNSIQETPWAINKDIAAILQWTYDNGIHINGMPRKDLLPMPPKVEQELWEAYDDVQRKGKRIIRRNVLSKNRSILSDKSVLQRDLETAKELAGYERFYLPHNLDFRGRVYPVPHFNNQRSDHIKALFLFADGVELGEGGAGWLAVHLANCGDFDKVSKKPFADRIQWVTDNEETIIDVANDPQGTAYYWSDADKPFCFLAACIEYAAWVAGGRSDEFVSHIPVALDGSNSGLQHYSAALRSEEEAGYVSLSPSEFPADLYQIVSDKVNEEMLADIENTDDEQVRLVANLCQDFGITRSTVKRNVMTYAYSSGQFGFCDQIMEDTMRPLDEAVLTGRLPSNPLAIPREDGAPDGGFRAARYIAVKSFQAVTSVVHSAATGMDFFKKVAATLAHEAKPTFWVTPLGLPVVHNYQVWQTKTVELFLFDRAMPVIEAGKCDKIDGEGRGVIRQVRANVRTRPLGRIDKDKARSAVAPNLIHSMDGSHLMLTVLRAQEEGLRHFSLIHDSFGTHAGHTDRFFSIIREAFVEMYTDYCPFEEIRAQAVLMLSEEGVEKLPELPTKGSFDLNQVLDADYAFA